MFLIIEFKQDQIKSPQTEILNAHSSTTCFLFTEQHTDISTILYRIQSVGSQQTCSL